MDWTRDANGWAPDWFRGLGFATWLVDPGGILCYVNALAEEALGVQSPECLGCPCAQIVRGLTESGEPQCRKDCSIQVAARSGGMLEPFLIECAKSGPDESWLLVLPIALDAPGDQTDPYLMHMAVNVGRSHRIEAYLAAALQGAPRVRPVPREKLTPRELEVLELLARNEHPKRIARTLFVSHATVRNHIQNVLRKLDVHSIQEAVALQLLSR